MDVWVLLRQEYQGYTSILNIYTDYTKAVEGWERARLQLMDEAKDLQFDIIYDQLKSLKLGDATNWYYPVLQKYNTID